MAAPCRIPSVLEASSLSSPTTTLGVGGLVGVKWSLLVVYSASPTWVLRLGKYLVFLVIRISIFLGEMSIQSFGLIGLFAFLLSCRGLLSILDTNALSDI